MSTVTRTVIYTIDGQPIHTHEDGPDGRKVVLLIHGWSSSWYALSPVINQLKRQYRCVGVDLPGFGASPRLPEKATIPRYAQLMASLARELSDKPIILIGHSMGGMISLNISRQYPDLVERMILLSPTISGHLSMFINLFISPITFFERFSVTNALVSLLEPHMFGITDRLMRPASFAEETGITEEEYHMLRADARRAGQGKVRAECYSAMRDNDLRGKIGDIEVPALVIWGMEDNTVPLRDASVIAREWSDADLRIIPNAGHWPHFEARQVVQRYVRGFMSTPIKLLNFLDDADDEP